MQLATWCDNNIVLQHHQFLTAFMDNPYPNKMKKVAIDLTPEELVSKIGHWTDCRNQAD